MVKGKKMYAAVRLTENGEWIDSDSLALSVESVMLVIDRFKKTIPSWDKENPVVRIVEVVVNEISTVHKM